MKRRAEETFCTTGGKNRPSAKPLVVTAYTHPAQRGKRLLAAMANPVNTPPTMNSNNPKSAVPKREVVYVWL